MVPFVFVCCVLCVGMILPCCRVARFILFIGYSHMVRTFVTFIGRYYSDERGR